METNFGFQKSILNTVKDFLFELGMKLHMHIVEISILSLNNLTVRPTKIMKIQYILDRKKMESFDQFSTLKNDFENQNFEFK